MKLKIGLNTKDIDNAINALDAYKADLPKKAEQIRKEIAQLIQNAADYNFGNADYDYIVGKGFEGAKINVYVRDEQNVSVVFTNQLEAIFIEFGAGVYFNGPAGTSPHPSASKHAFYIGSYGKHYGKYDIWSFQDRSGKYVETYGTPASMSLWRALQTVIPFIPDIVKGVFAKSTTGGNLP